MGNYIRVARLTMEQTIQRLNELRQQGIIERYAIGGAIAALFYLEPFETHDLDVFVVLPSSAGPLLTLDRVYQHLQAHGYQAHGEQIVIAGVPVQFLVAGSALVEAAIIHAVEKTYGSQVTSVFSPEYLLAIMADLGRPKDRIRIGMFLEQGSIDRAVFKAILERYQLEAKWAKILRALGHASDESITEKTR